MPEHSSTTTAQCQAIAASGERCKAKPHKNGLCFFHSDPQRAADLGRKGGRRKVTFAPEELKEMAAPKSAEDIRDLLAQSIVELREGKLDSKRANAISYLSAGLLRAIEVVDLEARLEAKGEPGQSSPGVILILPSQGKELPSSSRVIPSASAQNGPVLSLGEGEEELLSVLEEWEEEKGE